MYSEDEVKEILRLNIDCQIWYLDYEYEKTNPDSTKSLLEKLRKYPRIFESHIRTIEKHSNTK